MRRNDNRSHLASLVLWTLFLGVAASFVGPRLQRARTAARLAHRVRAVATRLDGLDAATAGELARLQTRVPIGTGTASALLPLAQSWEVIGGCGAGATTGAGGGIKWIGRAVRGGLVNVQAQSGYLRMRDGYSLVNTAQLTHDLTYKWTVGVLLPFLYKYYWNPYGTGVDVDVSNGGIGDINLMATRRLGPINATLATLSIGLPTGTHSAYFRTEANYLRQDRQLGLGKVTATAILDHTIDRDWGMYVVGGTFAYRGGENELRNYRAPVASTYAYAGYIMGPLVPSVGAALTGFMGKDRDRAETQPGPYVTLAANAALEWSNDYVAVLAGCSFPFSTDGLQPWTLAMGVALSTF